MNRHWTCCLAGLTCMVLLAGHCSGAYALDSRFELDPRVLDRKIAPAAKKGTTGHPRKSARKAARTVQPPTAAATTTPAEQPVASGAEKYPGTSLSLFRITPSTSAEGMASIRDLWKRLVPTPQPEGPLEIKADNFTLSLDPKMYEFIPAADGKSIIIDANRNLPPPVRSLIQGHDHDVRIVSESPTAGKRFYTQLLQAAGFYSVEPDFSMEFGNDPRLTVRADYRIERTPESLMRNETVLLYTGSGRYALPESLQGFLGNAGFQVIEPDLPRHDPSRKRDRFIQVASGSQFQVVDTVLAALGHETEAGKAIEFTGWSLQGISLKVRVDRAFDVKGKKYAVAAFDGNPVTYTLTRLLETQGMTVIVIGKEDDFSTVTRKLLAALELPASYDRHRLWPLSETPYTVQMTGFLLHEPGSDRNIFLTDRNVEPLIINLIDLNGYAVTALQPQTTHDLTPPGSAVTSSVPSSPEGRPLSRPEIP